MASNARFLKIIFTVVNKKLGYLKTYIFFFGEKFTNFSKNPALPPVVVKN
jgi:hypothetical protein